MFSGITVTSFAHQEQVPRKQGLKLIKFVLRQSNSKHQEQVPRKQGLKLHVRPESKVLSNIKSKFHENKD